MKTSALLASFTLALLSGCLTNSENREVRVDGQSFEVMASKAIVGSKDDRKLMPDDYVDPSTVAFVRNADDTICTGTTIGLSHVITAAHCVYDSNTKSIKTGITLIPGLHLAKTTNNPSRFFMKRIYIVEDYIKDVGFNGYTTYASSKDIAIIQVKEFEGNDYFETKSPRVELGKPEDFDIRGEKIDMIAYHADDATKSGSQYYVNPCYTQGKRNQYTAVYHDCDTMPSASGSSLVSDRKVYAIHTGKAGGSIYNNAALLTHELLEDIDKITLYETEGLKHFKVFELNEKGHSTVSIRNKCPKDLFVSVAYRDKEGNLRATEKQQLTPETLKLLNVETPETKAYVFAHTVDNSHKWTGDFSLKMPSGEVMDYLPVNLKVINGDTTFNFNCD